MIVAEMGFNTSDFRDFCTIQSHIGTSEMDLNVYKVLTLVISLLTFPDFWVGLW